MGGCFNYGRGREAKERPHKRWKSIEKHYIYVYSYNKIPSIRYGKSPVELLFREFKRLSRAPPKYRLLSLLLVAFYNLRVRPCCRRCYILCIQYLEEASWSDLEASSLKTNELSYYLKVLCSLKWEKSNQFVGLPATTASSMARYSSHGATVGATNSYLIECMAHSIRGNSCLVL